MYEFKSQDILINTLKLHPKISIKFVDGVAYYKNIYSSDVPSGHVALEDLNLTPPSSGCGAEPKLDFSCPDLSYYVGVI